MATNEHTSDEMGTLASELMHHPDPKVRRLAACALTQVRDRERPKGALGLLPRVPLGPPVLERFRNALAPDPDANAMFGSLSPPGAHKLYK